MYMLHDLTVATLLLPPQTTLDVCHMCKKKITERVSDSSSYPCSISHWERWSGLIDCLIPTSSFVPTGTQLNKTGLEIARWVLAGIHGFMHCVYILAAATIRWWRLFHLELLIVQLLFNSSSNWRNTVKIMYSAPSNTRLAHSHTPGYQNVSFSLQGVCTEVCCLSNAYCSSTCEL